MMLCQARSRAACKPAMVCLSRISRCSVWFKRTSGGWGEVEVDARRKALAAPNMFMVAELGPDQ